MDKWLDRWMDMCMGKWRSEGTILIEWCGYYFLLTRGQFEYEQFTANYTKGIKAIHS